MKLIFNSYLLAAAEHYILISIVCVLPENRFPFEKPRGNCTAGNGKSSNIANISNDIQCPFILLGPACTLKAKTIILYAPKGRFQ